MAILWMDNFQQYGTNSALLLNGPYAENSGSVIAADPDPLATGNVLKLPTGSAITDVPWGNLIRKVITPSTTAGVMMRVWLSSLPADGFDVCKPIWFADSGKNTMISLRITINGTVQVWRSNTNAPQVLIGETSACIVANSWQHLEARVVFDGSAGTVEIRVNTVQVLIISGQNTQGSSLSTSCSNIMVSNAYFTTGSGPNLYVKDFAVWDSTGTINANFLGNCFVYSQRPSSDVSGTWSIVGGAGSGWASINETSPDDDTKYVSSPWPAATADQFGLTSLPAAATGVKAMMPVTRSRKSDGGDGSLQTSLVSGGSTGSGTNRPITTAYSYYNDVMETDPATGVAWSVAGANAAKLKLDRTL